MKSSVYRLILPSAVVISIALGGCAAVVERERLPAYHTLEVALGVASNRAIAQRTPWVFRGHGYVLSRRTHAPTLRIFETKWMTRDAYDDEAIPDSVFVETRLLIRVGRLMQVEGFRLVAPGAQNSQTVWLVAETRVRTREGEIHVPVIHSKKFVEYTLGIAEELQNQYRLFAIN